MESLLVNAMSSGVFLVGLLMRLALLPLALALLCTPVFLVLMGLEATNRITGHAIPRWHVPLRHSA